MKQFKDGIDLIMPISGLIFAIFIDYFDVPIYYIIANGDIKFKNWFQSTKKSYINKKSTMRKRFFKLVEPSDSKGDPNYYFDIFILSLIILNVLAIILASDQNIGNRFQTFF